MFYLHFTRLFASLRPVNAGSAGRRSRPRRRPTILESLESRRVLSAGSLDTSFDSDGLMTASLTEGVDLETAVGQQTNGKLIFAGNTIREAPSFLDKNVFVTRRNADGSLDTSFGASGVSIFDPEGSGVRKDQTVAALAVDALDRIIVVGTTVQISGGFAPEVFVTRFLADGTHDTSFGTGGFVTISSPINTSGTRGFGVATDASNRIVVAGRTEDHTTDGDDILVARFTEGGAADTSFGTSGIVITDLGSNDDSAQDVVIDSSNRIVVTGTGRTFSNAQRAYVARYLDDGSPDSTFAPSTTDVSPDNVALISPLLFRNFGTDSVFSSSLVLQPVGASERIVIAGTLQLGTSSSFDFALARLDDAGNLDTTFNSGATSPMSPGVQLVNILTRDLVASGPRDSGPSLALQPDNTLLVGSGGRPSTSDPHQFALARLLSGGTLDTSFDTDGIVTEQFSSFSSTADARITDLLVQADGRIVAAGAVDTALFGNNFEIAAARYLSGLGAAPVAEAGGPYTVAEGGTTPLSGSATDADHPSGPFVFEWDLDGDGKFGETGLEATRGDEQGQNVTFEATGLVDGEQVIVKLRVTDPAKLFHIDTATVDVEAANSPPTITADNPTVTVNEGDTATNTGTFNDPDGDPVTLDASVGTVTATGANTWSWSFDTTNDSDSQTVTITATSAGPLVDTVDFDLIVNNVPPTVDAGGPYVTFFDAPIALSGAATDPADVLTIEWDLDDDGVFGETGAAALAGDETGLNPTFDPSALGITTTTDWPISFRATDDTVSVTDTATITVIASGTELIDGTLHVGGSAGGEPVVVRIVNGQLQVRGNFLPGGSAFFDPNQVQLVNLHMGDGDDIAIVANGFPIDVHMDGGAGNDILISGEGNDVIQGGPGNDLIWGRDGDDVLRGGAGDDDLLGGTGNDVLIGGDGDDQLFGGSGRDLLIGGINSDMLWGGNGEDILIGGTTAYDDYDAAAANAIDQVMSIWTSSDTYDQRVDTLTGPSGLLEAGVAVFNDDDSDVLNGGGGRDLFFADTEISDPNADFLLFTSPFEEIEEL